MGPKVGQKLKKNLNFANVQFPWKVEFSKTFFNILFLSLNSTTCASFNKIAPYLGELGLKKPPKWPNSWMIHPYENFWKFITWELYILWRWNLLRLCIFMRTFIWQKIWVSPIWSGRAWPKNLWKKPQKIDFLGSFLRIFNNISKPVTYVVLSLALNHWWKFCTNWTWIGLVIYDKPPKSSQKFYFLLVRETLKLYNLTTTNAIPMQLTRIVYLHEAFHLTQNWGVTHREKEGRVQKLLNPNHKMRFLG